MLNFSKMKAANYVTKRVGIRTKQTKQTTIVKTFSPLRLLQLFIKSVFPKKKYQRNFYAEYLEENN